MRLVASAARVRLRANERASVAGSLLDRLSDMRKLSRDSAQSSMTAYTDA